MSYVQKGKKIHDHDELFALHCPVTHALLEASLGERLMTGTPFSYTFFSTMPAGTQIAPHHGSCNLKLRLHLPLFVPKVEQSRLQLTSTNVPPLYLRVADTVKTWEEGKLLIFDDTYEHEAGNMVQASDLMTTEGSGE